MTDKNIKVAKESVKKEVKKSKKKVVKKYYCPYCGGINANGEFGPDVLCNSCIGIFGHTRFSDL